MSITNKQCSCGEHVTCHNPLTRWREQDSNVTRARKKTQCRKLQTSGQANPRPTTNTCPCKNERMRGTHDAAISATNQQKLSCHPQCSDSERRGVHSLCRSGAGDAQCTRDRPLNTDVCRSCGPTCTQRCEHTSCWNCSLLGVFWG